MGSQSKTFLNIVYFSFFLRVIKHTHTHLYPRPDRGLDSQGHTCPPPSPVAPGSSGVTTWTNWCLLWGLCVLLGQLLSLPEAHLRRYHSVKSLIDIPESRRWGMIFLSAHESFSHAEPHVSSFTGMFLPVLLNVPLWLLSSSLILIYTFPMQEWLYNSAISY